MFIKNIILKIFVNFKIFFLLLNDKLLGFIQWAKIISNISPFIVSFHL